MVYRPDIDGLRAVAVLLVCVYHFGLGCKFGYIGVDIFFVISGFLIYTRILEQIRTGSFRLVDFWVARFWRLMPALTAVLFITIAASLVLRWAPMDVRWLASSAIAAQLGLGNLYWGRNLDYFSPESETLPLLHTWSLGVEEQFYLVAPILLVLGRRLTFFSRGLWLLSLFLLSAIFSSILFGEGSAWWYYHPAGRAWEMLAGALVVHLPTQRLRDNAVLRCLDVVALVALFVMASFGSGLAVTNLPMLPVVGCTAFLLRTRGDTSLLAAVGLQSRPVVAVGKASYSIYLVHWPIKVLVGGVFGYMSLGVVGNAVLLLTSVAAGFGLKVLVEDPFRKRARGGRGVVVDPRAWCLSVLFISGLLRFTDGLEARFSPHQLDFLRTARPEFVNESSFATVSEIGGYQYGTKGGRMRAAIVGDSFGMAVTPGLHKASLEAGWELHQFCASATPPLVGFVPEAGLGDEAPKFMGAVVQRVINGDFSVVFLAAAWRSVQSDPDFALALSETISVFTAAGVAVCVVKSPALQPLDPPRAFVSPLALRLQGQVASQGGHALEMGPFDQVLRGVLHSNLTVIDPGDVLVANGVWPWLDSDGLIYRDRAHLSTRGGEALEPLFARELARLSGL